MFEAKYFIVLACWFVHAYIADANNGADLVTKFGNKRHRMGVLIPWIKAWKICEACLKRQKTRFDQVQRVIKAINSSGKHL
jgi:hypothetical protein